MSKLVAGQYDDFQTSFNQEEKQKQYLNYGFTLNPSQTLEEKQELLCKKVFDEAQIQPGDVIVDVGFGSGQQDFLLADLYPFKKLTGYNISPNQVANANQWAQEKNLASKMEFKLGPAETLEYNQNESVDKILAIECAFYFNRSSFYHAAARVLKPGGLLVKADISFNSLFTGYITQSEKYRNVGTLSSNRANWQAYFRTKTIFDITRNTRPGAQQAVFKIWKNYKNMSAITLLSWRKMAYSSQLAAWGMFLKILKYHIIVLEKR